MPSRKNPKNFSHREPAGSFPRVLRDSRGAPLGGPAPIPSGAPSAGTRFGVVLGGVGITLGLRAFTLWYAVRVLRSAGALGWSLDPWQAVVLSVLWVVWTALGRVGERQP